MALEDAVLYESEPCEGFSEFVVRHGAIEQLPLRRFIAPPVGVRIVHGGEWGPHSQVPRDSTGRAVDVAPLRVGDISDNTWSRYPPPRGSKAPRRPRRSRAAFSVPAFGPWPDNFYHWSVEILPRVFFALSMIPNAENVDVLVPEAATRDKTFLELLHLVIRRPHNVAVCASTVRFNCGIVSDSFVSSSIYSEHLSGNVIRDTGLHPRAFLAYQQSLHAGLVKSGDRSANGVVGRNIRRRVFLDRGPVARRPYNREDVIRSLVSLNVHIIQPHKYSRTELGDILRNAEIVIAPHGAGISNIMLCANLKRLVVLVPSTHLRQRALWTNLAGAQGASAVYVKGAAPPDYSDGDRRSHVFDVNDVATAVLEDVGA